MANVLNISHYEEKLEKVREYLGIPFKDRMPYPTFRKVNKIRRNEFLDMKHTIEEKDREIARITVRNANNNLMRGLEESADEQEEDYNSEQYLGSRSKEVDEALIASCELGNANSLRTYYQLTKRLVEKSEVTHKLSGAVLAQLAIQAQRELRAVDERVVKVSK